MWSRAYGLRVCEEEGLPLAQLHKAQDYHPVPEVMRKLNAFPATRRVTVVNRFQYSVFEIPSAGPEGFLVGVYLTDPIRYF